MLVAIVLGAAPVSDTTLTPKVTRAFQRHLPQYLTMVKTDTVVVILHPQEEKIHLTTAS